LHYKKTLTVITEGGKELGFGHITRTIAIVSAFKNYNIKFIINGDESVDFVLNDFNYELFDWLNNKEIISRLKDSDLILLDSILISNKQIKQIEKTNIPIIFIDDEKRRNILERGYVVDWTVLSETKDYFIPKKPNVKYLLGSIYTPLRDEFNKISKHIIKEHINSILITFGGSDVRDMTPLVMDVLNKNYSDITKNIVIGNGFSNIKKIEKLKDNNTNLIYNVDAQRMATLMSTNDLAISAGGQTLYELALVGIPTIAILLVENAKDDTFGWEKVGFIENIGWYDDINIKDNLLSALKQVEDKNKRVAMQKSAKIYIQPNGAKRLYNGII